MLMLTSMEYEYLLFADFIAIVMILMVDNMLI